MVDLVKSRLEKAASVQSEDKQGSRLDLEKMSEEVLVACQVRPLPEFPGRFVRGLDANKRVELPAGREIRTESTLNGFFLVIDDTKIECSSMEEALYLYWAASTGQSEAFITADVSKMSRAVDAVTEEYEERVKKIDKWLNKNILSLKDKKEIRARILQKLLKWRGPMVSGKSS